MVSCAVPVRSSQTRKRGAARLHLPLPIDILFFCRAALNPYSVSTTIDNQPAPIHAADNIIVLCLFK